MQVPAAAPPRRFRSSWIRLLALFALAGFIETMFYGQLSAFTPLYLPDLGVPPGEVLAVTGWIAAFSSLIGIPFLPLWGALADRYARKPVIIRSFVVHLAAIAVMLLARNVWAFALGRALTSFALGNSGLMLATLAERAPSQRIGLAFSIVNAAAPIGAFVGPLIGGLLYDAAGFAALLWINAVLMSLVIVLLAFGYHDTYHGRSEASIWRMAADSLRIIWQSRRLRTMFPALFLLFAGWMLAFTYLSLAVTAVYAGDKPGTAVGLVAAAGGLAALVISPIVGALADRHGHWRVLLVGAAVTVVLWPLPALTPGLVGFIVTWSLLNGVMSGVFAISFTVLSAAAPAGAQGRVMSYAYLPINLGGFFGPLIGSVVTAISVFTIFPVAALITAAGTVAMAYSRRQSPELAGRQVAPATGGFGE